MIPRNSDPIFVFSCALAAAVVGAWASAAAAEPQLVAGDPFALDEPIPGTGGGPFGAPAIAASEAGWLAVFEGDGLGTRLDPETLAPLDPDGLPALASFVGAISGPKVASDGGTYLVLGLNGAWEEDSVCLRGALLDAATGEALGEPIALGVCESDPCEWFAISPRPEGGYVAAWGARYDEVSSVLSTRVDGETGAALDGADGIFRFDAHNPPFSLTVAEGPDGDLFAYNDDDVMRFFWFPDAGEPSGPEGFFVDGIRPRWQLELVHTGEAFFAVWGHAESGTGLFSIRAAALDPELQAISAPAIVREGDSAYLPGYPIDADADGEGGLSIVWSESAEVGSPEDVFGAALSVAGSEIVSSAVLPLSALPLTEEAPAVAMRSGRGAAAWRDERNHAWHVYGARFDEGGILDAGGVPIATAPNDETLPSIAASGDGALAIWSDTRATESCIDLYGMRFAPDGAPSDAAALPIASVDGDEIALGAAATGGVYWALWASANAEGTASTIGVTPVPTTGGSAGDAIVLAEISEGWSDGAAVGIEASGVVLALWTAGDALHAATLGEGGVVAAPEEPLYESPAPPDEESEYGLIDVAAAGAGTIALVTWVECLGSPGLEAPTECARRGTLLDLSDPAAVAPIGAVTGLEALIGRSVTVVASEEGFAAVWVENDGATGSAALWTRTVSPADGALGEPVLVGALERQVVGLSAAPLAGGWFLSTLELVPAEEEGTYGYAGGGIFVDAARAMPYPQLLFEDETNGVGAPLGDALIHVGEARRDAATRLQGRIVAIDDPDPVDAGADRGDGAGSACACRSAGSGTRRVGSLLGALL